MRFLKGSAHEMGLGRTKPKRALTINYALNCIRQVPDKSILTRYPSGFVDRYIDTYAQSAADGFEWKNVFYDIGAMFKFE